MSVIQLFVSHARRYCEDRLHHNSQHTELDHQFRLDVWFLNLVYLELDVRVVVLNPRHVLTQKVSAPFEDRLRRYGVSVSSTFGSLRNRPLYLIRILQSPRIVFHISVPVSSKCRVHKHRTSMCEDMFERVLVRYLAPGLSDFRENVKVTFLTSGRRRTAPRPLRRSLTTAPIFDILRVVLLVW